MTLKIGGPAPEFSLPNLDDQPVTLAELLQNTRTLLLVFLRHLG